MHVANGQAKATSLGQSNGVHGQFLYCVRTFQLFEAQNYLACRPGRVQATLYEDDRERGL